MSFPIASLPVSFDASTQYQSFDSIAEELTTSDLWVLKALFTTTSLTAGRYILHYRAQVTNTSKKTVGFQVNWRLNAGAYNEVEVDTKPPALANTYETRGSFAEITVAVDGIVDIQINYGMTTAGGTGKIKNVDAYIFKVGDL